MMNHRAMTLLVGLLALAPVALAEEAKGPSQEELEQKLAETLTGATLVGQFTVVGVNDDKPLAPDKYTLGTVKKLKDDLWSFEARIQYGKNDVKLTLAIPVKWAGDTPVISVSKVAFPGLGTYTARVVIYGDQYAGTWSGSDHGGQMFGKIVKEKVDEDKAETAEAKEAAEK